MCRLIITSLILLCFSTVGSADILIDSYSDATNDRFTNSGSFILAAQNLSGIGQTAGGANGTAGNWATAISSNVVITAFHFRPSIGEDIYFYPGNDPSVSPVVRSIVSGEQIDGTDLYIGVLDSNLPTSINHFSYAAEFLSGTPPNGNEFFVEDAGSLQGLNAYLFGRSPFSHNTNNSDQAVGRNLVTGYSENVPFQGNTDNDSLIFFYNAMSDADYVRYESKFRGGDSGGPTFVEINGELVLVGTNAFVNGAGSSVEFSGINYIGNQSSAVADFINLNAVPEPSGLIAIAFFAGLATTFRSRRRT